MKILVFGADGQVGREIPAVDDGRNDLALLRRPDADLSIAGAAAAAIAKARPEAVINAAAWTAVDRAESNADAAFRINADAVGEIAAACARIGARFVHISTDYVYSGYPSDRPLSEDAETGPLNVYGASKLKGETAALASGANVVILRTSWVYSVHGANFVKTMLKLAETREEVPVVADQTGGPTPASAIAKACLALAARRDGPCGVYHFQGAPPATWADFARAVFAAGARRTEVKDISTMDYPTPARRPAFTVLDCSKIRRDYGISQPDWKSDLTRTVAAIDGTETLNG